MSAESVARIEPARLEEPTSDIADVIAELAASSATLGKALTKYGASRAIGPQGAERCSASGFACV
jgi:hypothetical protein